MNQAFSTLTISGRVVDVGGGRAPDYFRYLTQFNVTSIEPIDGSLSAIDFEQDALPFEAQTVDTVLICNTLEHVYHYGFLLGECARILRSKGRIVGFVPFFVGYHPDPHDYFRYTKEALHRMLLEAGFSTIEVKAVGGGPFLSNFNTIVLSFPRAVRPLLYLPYALLDTIFLLLRPQGKERFPLGYTFTGII